MSSRDPLYLPGFRDAYDRVARMDDAQLYQVLDDLYGRGDLPDNPTTFDLRQEARRQLEKEFRNPDAKDRWEFVDFMVKAHRANRRDHRTPMGD